MILIIPEYTLNFGLKVENAAMVLTNYEYNFLSKELTFNTLIYLNKESFDNNFAPMEGAIMATIPAEPTDNFEDLITNIIFTKVKEVDGKTPEEIAQHNSAIQADQITNYWLDTWDINMQKYSGIKKYGDLEIENGE